MAKARGSELALFMRTKIRPRSPRAETPRETFLGVSPPRNPAAWSMLYSFTS